MVKPTFPARQTLDAHGDAWWRDIPDRPTAGQPEAFNAYLRRAAELNIPITPAVRIEARRAGGNTKHRPVETFVRGQEASGIAKMFADQRATTAAQNAAHAAAAEERRRALEAAGYVLQTATTAPVVPTLTASQQADLIAKGYIAPAPTATATVTPAGPTAKAAEPVTLPAAVTAPSTVTTVEPAGPTADTRAWEWRQVVAAAKTLPTPAKIGAGLAVAGLLYALFSPSTETAHAPRYR